MTILQRFPSTVRLVLWSTVFCVGLTAGTASALPPTPPNDTPATAQVIGPALPALIYGTSVLADNTIANTGIAGVTGFDDGPDVFYSLTPTTTGTYRLHLWPWQHAPLRSSDRRFSIYVFIDLGGGSYSYLAGARAPGDARPVFLDVALTASTQYFIGVDHDDIAHDNFDFGLAVDLLTLTNPDTCALAIALPTALPVVVENSIDGAANDFGFVQDGGRCGVSGTPTPAAGNDHVYLFHPVVAGDYAIEVVSNNFDAVLYVDDSCDPFFPDGCLGASNHSTGGTSGAKHELVVVTLEADTDYWVFVDNGSTTALTGNYTLIIDDAFNYEINELEPNDTPATATPITTPLNGGQLVGPTDEDWYAVSGLTGDRVYAWVNNGGSTNSTLDTGMSFFAADGTTLIEFDDEDGDGADAPIEDLRFIYSTDSPVIAGAQFTSDGTHYLQVVDSSATGTVDRYRLHVGVEPASRTPVEECEPNNTLAAAGRNAKNFFAGAITEDVDVDVYAFTAAVGDRVFVALDGDPERDGTGTTAPSSDPKVLAAKLVLKDPAGDILISDISDANSIQSAPDFAAQGGFFVARTTGTHYVEVSRGDTSQFGPERTYQLAIFLNDAAPALADEVDPVLTLTPDYVNDFITLDATDNAAGDSGICNVEILNNDNLQITGTYTPPAAAVNLTIDLVNPAANGAGIVLVTDCAGNTTCALVAIDVFDPVCSGANFSHRMLPSLHGPIHVPDNTPAGANGLIEVTEPGTISDVNVTVWIETVSSGDIDLFLESPTGTRVELVTDRASSLAFDILDATFDDSATELLPILSSAEPFSGTWRPEDPLGLAKLNGENALGTWKLNVIDDSSSESFGSRLVKWTLNIDAGFAAPETFAGTADDTVGNGGIQSIVLNSPVNTQLNLPPGFVPGDQVVPYTVTLVDPGQNGSGTVVVTDTSNNTCTSSVTLAGFVDAAGPSNAGSLTRDLKYGAEVQANVPPGDFNGVASVVNVPDAFTVGEVEVDLTVDAKDLGRMAAKLTHAGEFASLINRTGMDERASAGLTKPCIEVTLDDDAPVADDAHLEPALGTIPFLGLHQPDGRGEFFGDGITTDVRRNMLLQLGGLNSAGSWEMLVGDFRLLSPVRSTFRRWSMTLKSPCGPEYFVGTAREPAPQSGIASLALAPGATNVTVTASFTPGAAAVEYRISLVDPALPGSGTLEITDVAGNVTSAPISLGAASDDTNRPAISGALDPESLEFEGTATDAQALDSGIVSVELLPWSDNLQLVAVTPDPPSGATSVDFVVGRINPAANGRGYVRVTDACGWRSHLFIDIDGLAPECTGTVGHTKRYRSTDLPQAIPDNNAAGVSSSIVVSDTDIVADVDVTFNITHAFDADIDMTLTSPQVISLMTDIGSLGNDFIDTTLDDEGEQQIPDTSAEAPFTGSYQPEGGPAFFVLDGVPANGTYILKVVDDKVNDTGTFDSWSLLMTSPTFPERYDGRAADGAPLDSGICSVALLPGAQNLVLTPDPFDAGDAIVRYSVALSAPTVTGFGTVRVVDCAGNECEVPLALGCADADYDHDGDLDAVDYSMFRAAFGTLNATVDLDGDGRVTLRDYQIWLACYRDFVGNPLAEPPVRRKPLPQPVPLPPSEVDSTSASQND